ncbi:DEAD/DEAH box helicase [Verrucomicrobiales bacterium]|jgi:ATP-dependent RNA helicase RhlE|nr:DEAD/DEAH box helicase [Verrucomicrobiales bacterium]
MADLQKNCQCMAFTAPFRFPPNYDVASPQRLYDADMPSFHAFDLIPSLQTTLKKEAFVTPTEIQELTIPSLLKGNSVVGVAETGSGKTLAYALPVLQKIKQLELDGESVTEAGLPRAIVIVPSSDLGEQVAKVFKVFTHETRLRVRTALGGMAMNVVRRNVKNPFEILLATPGRLEQLMQQKEVSLSDLRFLVFDEADQILDQGFRPVITRILRASPDGRQLALFTATASDDIQTLISELFSHAEQIETQGRHRLVSTLKTVNREVPNGRRFPLLEEILSEEIEGGTLLFANTKEQCDKVAEELTENGYTCAVFRGDMDKKERRQNLQKFRDGTLKLLIATELGARGLDVENIDRVLNYHLPKELKNYLHRAGRTARAGRKGTVINFVTERDENLMQRLDSIGG